MDRLIPPVVAAALAQSRFARLPPEVAASLVEGAMLIDVPLGAVPQRQEDPPSVGLMVSGLLRAFFTTMDGRQLTVRYARAGSLLAVAALHMKGHRLNQQALTPCRILALQPSRLIAIAEHDARVANLFAEENAYRLFHVLDELAGNTFGTMRQRLVRYLLDLAAGPTGQRAPLIARGTQQALADAVGTVREVVVRLLRELREEGLIRTSRDEIELLEPERLATETFLHRER